MNWRIEHTLNGYRLFDERGLERGAIAAPTSLQRTWPLRSANWTPFAARLALTASLPVLDTEQR